MTVTTSLRNGDVTQLMQLLANQRAHQIDVVTPSTALSARDGLIRIDTDELYMGTTGFTPIRGTYDPTDLFLGGLAERLNVPVGYLRRMQAERTDIFDFTVNRHLHGQSRNGEMVHPEDARSHMFRGFWTDEADQPGLARSLMSPSYKILDNYDVANALLEALSESGLHTEIRSADITERRMVIKFWAPEIDVLAEELVNRYRSPFDTGHNGSKRVSVGARFSNSETGDGRFQMVPEAIILVCLNGQTIKKDMIAKTHLGGRLENGPVVWSAETQKANVELVRKQVGDVVRAWLNPEYLTQTVAYLERNAGVEISNPADTVKAVAKQFAYSEEQSARILDFYLNGGQPTAGGIAQAITAYSQTVDNGDTAHDLDMTAVEAMEFAASLARKAS
jgi:hypothetical protein